METYTLPGLLVILGYGISAVTGIVMIAKVRKSFKALKKQLD